MRIPTQIQSQLRLLCLSILVAGASLPVHALGRLADVRVLDRDSGATVPTYRFQGETWIAGRPGARYAIAIRNRIGERLMAVTSVDGVNVVSGETASWDQTGYVFSPWVQYQITGWRKSSEEVAAFEFAAASNSYASRTGRPGSIGVIGVALFRENLPEPVAQAQVPPESAQAHAQDSARRVESEEAKAASGSRGAAPNASADGGASARGSADQMAQSAQGSLSNERQAKPLAQAMPAPKLGTGHGQRESSVVARTSFERRQQRPDEIIRIRYDSRENLIAAGVIPQPAPYPRPDAIPFPLSEQASYVPDPPPLRN